MKKMILVLGLGMVVVAAATGVVFGDSDEYKRGKISWSDSRLDVAPVSNPLYRTECGECHFAYQPGFLPARSWLRIMDTLDDHFGENAELDQEVRDEVRNYLVENSADKSDYRRSRAMRNSLANHAADTPLRITKMPYFIKEHDELPLARILRDERIGSLSNCSACHQRAESGSYNEDEINIPGIGRWDD